MKSSIDCVGGCGNCSSWWLGGVSPWDIYQDYIDGKREIKEINAEYMDKYRQGRNIMWVYEAPLIEISSEEKRRALVRAVERINKDMKTKQMRENIVLAEILKNWLDRSI